MDRKGEITIFLAMILMCICALLCAVVESARTAGARCYLRMALDSSMDSLMSQYHRQLWKGYRILGLEYDKKETLEGELEGFLKPYMEAGNWYPMKAEKTAVQDMAGLTQADGRYLEQEILDYMRYGLFDTKWDEVDEEGAGTLLKAWKEGGSVNRISGLYSAHSKEAVRLEKALEDIDKRLDAQRKDWEQAGSCLDSLDGGGFISEAERMEGELEKLPGLVGTYEKRADQLQERLKKSGEQFAREEGDLSDTVKIALEDEISQYESYVSKDGERRQQVERLRVDGPDRIGWIRDVIRAAQEVMDYIDSWEPDDDDDELDEEALWQPVRERWKEYSVLTLGIEFGVKDKEKEGVLEQIGEMAESGLLELVLPEATVLSGGILDLNQSPSAMRGKEEAGEQGTGRQDAGKAEGDAEEPSGGTGLLAGLKGLLEHLIVGEYDIRYFKGFEKEVPKDDFYELEYIVNGRERDRENLEGVVSRMVAFREGLNLIHILSDAAKRQEARNLAAVIVGAAGILPLISVMAFFIMAAWALGEAIMDVRDLLDGGRIPLIKMADDWKLDLDGLLDMGKKRKLSAEGTGLQKEAGTPGETRNGLDYKGYIRILIFGGYGPELVYRMMDVMQMNIRREQPGFSMGQCVCSVDAEASVSGKHLFFSTGLWRNGSIEKGFQYDTRMAVTGSYLEDTWNH